MGITRNSPCFFRAFIHNGRVNPASIPADTGYRHFCTIPAGIGFIDGLIHTQQRLFIVVTAHNNLPVNQPAFLTRPPIPIRAFRSGPAGSRYRRSGKPHDQERALNNTLSALPSLQHPDVRRFSLPTSHRAWCSRKVLRFPVSPFVFIQSLTICTQVVNGLYAVQM